jgi:hypothetical protein
MKRRLRCTLSMVFLLVTVSGARCPSGAGRLFTSAPTVRPPAFKPPAFAPRPPTVHPPPHGPHIPVLVPVLRPPHLEGLAPHGEVNPLAAKVAGSLKQVQSAGSQGDWARVSSLSQETLKMPGLPPGLRTSLVQIDNQARTLEALRRVETQLQVNARHAVLTQLPEANLPPSARNNILALTGLDELQTLLGGRLPAPPDVPAILKKLALLRSVTENPVLTARLQRGLALHAAVEGHEEAARRLLPAGATLPEPADRLRDLKRVWSGEGQASLLSGGQPAPTPADRLPIPELGPAGPRLMARESASADLPPLGTELQGAERRLRGRLMTDIQAQRQKLSSQTTTQLGRLEFRRPEEDRRDSQPPPAAHAAAAENHLRRGDFDPGRRERLARYAAAVELYLNRPLRDAERVMAEVMQQQGMGPAEVASKLRGLK